MRSSQCIFFLLPFATAWPYSKHQGYGTSTIQLHENLQDAWYTKYTKDNQSEVTTLPTKNRLAVPGDPTRVYSCVGPRAEDFPGQDKWLTLDQLWAINEPVIETVNGGSTYNDDLQIAIKEVASDSKVDARLILAIIMQESSGNISIHCTETTACGLMQHRGSAPFSAYNPKISIKNMIEDGIYGTPGVPGFLSYFNCDASAPSELTWVNTQLINGNPYAAAHVYNTGHIDDVNLSTDKGKSNYYAHDILSRLQGWNGWKGGCEKSRGCDRLGFGKRHCW
ncbi:hypothetical protein P171DRAFT_100427 [Karstenula rhodostoma CBS 690.94]|uniref:Transglycosylase SLT domain-containing protein n=1 Tax=Karstenula rhodostoma CBS 690.94 TaxID=1392251 RepID=A0A9P4PBK9_9PLEO|nr:hypothetical protein P171DRAFT_100427 [Karstenula rhodostoma CBS 690.94]